MKKAERRALPPGRVAPVVRRLACRTAWTAWIVRTAWTAWIVRTAWTVRAARNRAGSGERPVRPARTPFSR